MKTVKEILEHKPSANNFIHSGSRVLQALNRLVDVNLSYLIVKDGDEVKGIFSERDYTRKMILKGRSSFDTTVKEIMSVDMPEVQINDTVETCMELLASHGRRYLFAMDGKKFMGVITIHDLLREILLNKEDVFNKKVTGALIDINEQPSSTGN
ncbi:MAG TPA: CBS domain-containing protein [Parafilimonas sp.]|nr:CBS domain-containing protein [Parafilimonas sp.]